MKNTWKLFFSYLLAKVTKDCKILMFKVISSVYEICRIYLKMSFLKNVRIGHQLLSLTFFDNYDFKFVPYFCCLC